MIYYFCGLDARMVGKRWRSAEYRERNEREREKRNWLEEEEGSGLSRHSSPTGWLKTPSSVAGRPKTPSSVAGPPTAPLRPTPGTLRPTPARRALFGRLLTEETHFGFCEADGVIVSKIMI